ncbi:MAG: hypothetical protein JWN30_2887, partial [Bacilli bacterium]|nr:hypothetical protein [Bacilli bacterium]
MDTLMMAISLGIVNAKAQVKLVDQGGFVQTGDQKQAPSKNVALYIATVFACAEALMPLVGLLIGKVAGAFIGHWAAIIGGVALLAVAVWLIFFEDEDEAEEKLERNLIGWTLILTALSISVDELAVGFSIGLIGVPVGLTIILIALQAFVFTYAGLTFGKKLKPFLGEWAEKLAGIVLGVLGLWIIAEALIR